MINTVTKNYDNITNEFCSYQVTYVDSDIVISVPLDEANRHYQEILEWVAKGNTITDNGDNE